MCLLCGIGGTGGHTTNLNANSVASGCHKLVKREVPDDPVYDPKITATDKTDISGESSNT